jgi:hypothetical protein
MRLLGTGNFPVEKICNVNYKFWVILEVLTVYSTQHISIRAFFIEKFSFIKTKVLINIIRFVFLCGLWQKKELTTCSLELRSSKFVYCEMRCELFLIEFFFKQHSIKVEFLFSLYCWNFIIVFYFSFLINIMWLLRTHTHTHTKKCLNLLAFVFSVEFEWVLRNWGGDRENTTCAAHFSM